MQRIVRLMLTAALVYFVWQETGWATATAISLTAVAQELSSYALGNIIKIIKLRGA